MKENSDDASPSDWLGFVLVYRNAGTRVSLISKGCMVEEPSLLHSGCLLAEKMMVCKWA